MLRNACRDDPLGLSMVLVLELVLAHRAFIRSSTADFAEQAVRQEVS